MEEWIAKRDPNIMSGELCFTGTRVPVKNLHDSIRDGESIQEFMEGFPSVSREQIDAALKAGEESCNSSAK